MLKIKKTVIKIGLEKPIKILHMTDSHLPFYCSSDSPAMIKQGEKRNIKRSVRNFNKLLKYGEKNCDLIVHTGDLIDYISKPCVEFAKDFLKRDKFLFVAGNHEYAKYDGEKEDMAYRLQSMEEIGGYPVNVFFNSDIIGGVNFVGVDDAYHQVEYEQLEMLKKEAEKGYPIILFMHAPVYEKKLYEKSYKFWNGEICLLGSDARVHPEVTGDVAEPSQATKEFYEYVIGEPLIKAVLAGHLHFSFESRLTGNTVQYVTNRGDRGNAREITVV